jgi:hypothetical protein
MNVVSAIFLQQTLQSAANDQQEMIADKLQEKTAEKAGVSTDKVTVTALAGSVILRITIKTDGPKAAAGVTDLLSVTFADKDAATAFLAEVVADIPADQLPAGFGITAVADPQVSYTFGPPGSASEDEDNTPMIVGAVLGSVFGCCLLVAVAMMMKKRQTSVKTVVPA